MVAFVNQQGSRCLWLADESGVPIWKHIMRDYKPMYPNFPRQVIEATAAELYLNAVLHYLTAWVADVVGQGRSELVWLPDYKKQSREPLKDGVRLTVIESGTEDDLHGIFSGVISSKTSISETDLEELKWYFQNYKPALPESIPNKEVLAFVGALIPDSPALKKHIKTATDVLRLAVAMSGGDVSLAESAKFRSFTRRERRALLELLENCDNSIEDMLRWKGRWIRLGERLHPDRIPEMRSLAAEIKRDRAAVVAALAYEGSNGTAEDFARYNFRSSFSILGD